MSSTSRAILLPFLLAAVCSGVRAQDGSPTITAAGSVTTIPAPNGAAGWCYYCSDDNAPPLCNSQCTTAINRLCGENLNEGMTSTEQDCEIQYVPPKWPFNRNGARPNPPSETDCLDALNGILSGCGKDAGTPASGVNASYCTTSGGGGTFGWNDDGSVVPSSARYVIKTKGTDQCGQAQAPWQQATSVIQWDPNWIGENDQVVLITGAPSATQSAAFASMNSFPVPNPECDTQPCNIYGEPYYAESPQNPWQDGTDQMLRHRVIFEGWDTEAGALRFFNALHDRCQQWPYNWQVYKNGSQSVADFGLPSWGKYAPKPGIFDTGDVRDYCWCIAYAVFEASVGAVLPVHSFCPAGTTFPSDSEFAPARKRGLELDGPGLLKSVDKVIAKRAAIEAKAKRGLLQDVADVERE